LKSDFLAEELFCEHRLRTYVALGNGNQPSTDDAVALSALSVIAQVAAYRRHSQSGSQLSA